MDQRAAQTRDAGRRRRSWPKLPAWIIAVCGLWEFGDLAALLVPDFGHISVFLWNHIITGFSLMVAGVWAALSGKPGTVIKLYWLAAVAGVWLILAPFLLGSPAIAAGRWNDIIVGLIVSGLGAWAAVRGHR